MRKRNNHAHFFVSTTEKDSKMAGKRTKEEDEEEEGGALTNNNNEGESTPAAKRKGEEESTPNSAGNNNMAQYPNYNYPGYPPMPPPYHPMAYMGMPPGSFPGYQNAPMPLPPRSKKQRQSEEKADETKSSAEYGSPFPPGMFPPPPHMMMPPYGYPGFMPMYGGAPPGRPTKPRSAGIVLSMSCDTEQLSEYQILVRRQLEVFEATQEDVESNTQGRKKPVVLGQVGLRCRHCAAYPLRTRGRGAVYYPAKLFGVYQAAQNMAGSHLCQACQHIPTQIKMELRKLRVRRDNASGGKQYWADGCRALGIYEDGTCLRLEKKANEGGEGQEPSQME
jgi:hypothetical protein